MANPTIRRALVAIAALLLTGSPISAGIPEPDHYFYGTLRLDGQVLESAVVRLRSDDCTSVDPDHELACAVVRPCSDDCASVDPDHETCSLSGEGYVLVVPVEQRTELDAAPTPGVAAAGEKALFCVAYGSPEYTVEAGEVYMGRRGLAVRFDLEVPTIPGDGSPPQPVDVDADGIPDFRDPCFGVGSACQARPDAAVESRVAVGDPGNPPDEFNPDALGAVEYEYGLGETEVTNLEYLLFLQAVAHSEDPYGFYNELMMSDPRGGIVRMAGDPAGYTYAVKPAMGNKPVNFVSWLDAAAFANWMEQGQPPGPVAVDSVLQGAFDLDVEDPAGQASRNPEAAWTLPSENEWYKAAYYAPEIDAGDLYIEYPTSDGVQPVRALANSFGDVANPGPNVANYDNEAVWNGQIGNVTTAGTTGSLSPQGGADMAGNVAEWVSDDAVSGMRRLRGGSFLDGPGKLSSTADDELVEREAIYEGPDVGFRMIRVPEPGSISLGIGAALALLTLRAGRSRTRITRRD